MSINGDNSRERLAADDPNMPDEVAKEIAEVYGEESLQPDEILDPAELNVKKLVELLSKEDRHTLSNGTQITYSLGLFGLSRYLLYAHENPEGWLKAKRDKFGIKQELTDNTGYPYEAITKAIDLGFFQRILDIKDDNRGKRSRKIFDIRVAKLGEMATEELEDFYFEQYQKIGIPHIKDKITRMSDEVTHMYGELGEEVPDSVAKLGEIDGITDPAVLGKITKDLSEKQKELFEMLKSKPI
jgi:hypothetical protein